MSFAKTWNRRFFDSARFKEPELTVLSRISKNRPPPRMLTDSLLVHLYKDTLNAWEVLENPGW
jgi:hypothetical protein